MCGDYDPSEPVRCAQEHENFDCACPIGSTIFYGRQSHAPPPGRNGQEEHTWLSACEIADMAVATSNVDVPNCNVGIFGGDATPGWYGLCWCIGAPADADSDGVEDGECPLT